MPESPCADSENALRTLLIKGFSFVELGDHSGAGVVMAVTSAADRQFKASFDHSPRMQNGQIWASCGTEARHQSVRFIDVSVKMTINALTQSIGFANVMKCVSQYETLGSGEELGSSLLGRRIA